MTFTDDDLKRYRDDLENGREYPYGTSVEKILALLARLEAAEDALSSFEQGSPYIHNKDMERWRKAAGK